MGREGSDGNVLEGMGGEVPTGTFWRGWRGVKVFSEGRGADCHNNVSREKNHKMQRLMVMESFC